jgi:nitroimidazol reductase NimA-like FMN-containing flavoprotein (pyridoxamine 5'-phosphate oxidase superfamily)
MFFDDGAAILSETECYALLASETLGRLSMNIGALPVVTPVSYQYLGGDVIIGTADGPLRRAVARGNVIALGVDNAHFTDMFWSVLVIGRASEITDEAERRQLQMLGLAASTGMPSPHYLRLRPDIITGQRTAPTDPRGR